VDANLEAARASRAVERKRPSVWERTLDLCVMVTRGEEWIDGVPASRIF